MNFIQENLVFLLFSVFVIFANEEFCWKDGSCSVGIKTNSPKYLFYDVNYPEGFNLRRDVYMRLAVFIYSLNEKGRPWKLVLPPWHHLYHWRSDDLGDQNFLPWGLFFNIDDMKRFVPVIEFHEFMNEVKENHLDVVYVLKNFEEAFSRTDWDWSDKWMPSACEKEVLCSKIPCTGSNYIAENGLFHGRFWGFKNITSLSLKCLSFQGSASLLEEVLNSNPSSKHVMIDHAEVVLHDTFGDALYWKCRRSMRFSKKLIQEATKFRLLLGSNDTDDVTIRPKKWEDEKMQRRAVGGPYICAHMRRSDFLYGRRNLVPSLKYAGDQINSILKSLKLDAVFLATDSSADEVEVLQNTIKPAKLIQYKPDLHTRIQIKDGGVAIVDQIICSYSRYFIGTHESTFTFRIQEEREIIGFHPDATFNVFCATPENCFETSRWKIVY